jgi:hypothetical protein
VVEKFYVNEGEKPRVEVEITGGIL